MQKLSQHLAPQLARAEWGCHLWMRHGAPVLSAQPLPCPIFSQALHLPAAALDRLTLWYASPNHTIPQEAFELVISDEVGVYGGTSSPPFPVSMEREFHSSNTPGLPPSPHLLCLEEGPGMPIQSLHVQTCLPTGGSLKACSHPAVRALTVGDH